MVHDLLFGICKIFVRFQKAQNPVNYRILAAAHFKVIFADGHTIQCQFELINPPNSKRYVDSRPSTKEKECPVSTVGTWFDYDGYAFLVLFYLGYTGCMPSLVSECTI